MEARLSSHQAMQLYSHLPIAQANQAAPGLKCQFKDKSKLKAYIDARSHKNKNNRTLEEILSILIETMINDGNFDKGNPEIFICPEQLEAALGVNMFHSSEAKDLVLKQLVLPQTQTECLTTADQPGSIALMISPISDNSLFYVELNLLKVLRTLPEAGTTRVMFTYKEIYTLLNKYMHLRGLFVNPESPTRNPNIAVIREGDPLKAAFKLNMFHKCQLHKLLQNNIIQIIYVVPITVPHTTTSTITFETRTINNPTATQPREITPLNATSETAQHRGVRNQGPIIEFEPESPPRSRRPPCAMGAVSEASTSGSDSEIANESICYPSALHETPDSSNSADDSTDDTEDQTAVRSPILPGNKNLLCTTCNNPTRSPFKLCLVCWRTRKCWIGAHKPPATRKKKTTQKQGYDMSTDQPKNNQDSCIFCQSEPSDTVFVHGRNGHQVACHKCAKRHWKKYANCPVCRIKIQNIIKVFKN